jgi:hypothetical protein
MAIQISTASATKPIDHSGRTTNQAIAVAAVHKINPPKKAMNPVPKPMMLPKKGITLANTDQGLKIKPMPTIIKIKVTKRMIQIIIVFSNCALWIISCGDCCPVTKIEIGMPAGAI